MFARLAHRTSVAALVSIALLSPPVHAAPAHRGAGRPEPAFDAKYRQADEASRSGDFLAAARGWVDAAAAKPESNEHRALRAALFERVAEDYRRAIAADRQEATMREAIAAFDEYARQFASAHPGESLSEPIIQAREALRADLAALTEEAQAAKDAAEREQADAREQAAARERAAALAREPVAPTRPWKGLVIGGSVAIGGGVAMLAVGIAGAARANTANKDYAAMNCGTPDCSDVRDQGVRGNWMQGAGFVAASLLAGAGVGMLVVGMRRKAGPRRVAPMFGPGLAGAMLNMDF